MSEEFIGYTSNFPDWKYNKMIRLKDVDPFNSNKKLNIGLLREYASGPTFWTLE
jgi:hypothetical protein